MTVWYYSDLHRNRLGPVAANDLVQLHDNGQLAPEVLVWREGLPDWKPWREVMDEVLGRVPAAAAPARATFAVAGADAPAHVSGNPYELVERVPASPYAAPSAALDRHAMGVDWSGVVYAGFWKRTAAYFIDMFVVIVASIVVGAVVGLVLGASGGDGGVVMGLVQVLTSLAGIAYFAAFHASALQATPGKMAVGIKVARSDGEPISFLRGVGRYFASILSSLVLMLGYVMAGFTDRKQALHDMVCDTVVVDRWAFTGHPERQRDELGVVTVVILAVGGLGLVGLAMAFAGIVAALAAG